MDSDYSVSSESETGLSSRETKKRKRTGRGRDVMKILRATTHELGPDCFCKRFKCFTVVPEPERYRIIREFNELGNTDAQNSYISGLISVLPVIRRRPRKNAEESRLNNASFSYRVRIVEDGITRDVSVCIKAFLSFHGITGRRVRYVRDSLLFDGKAPIDMRGKHNSRPHKLSEVTKQKVMEFIKSLKGRKSHYSLADSNKIYLPENLNIVKLHKMYSETNVDNKISYESFREIFESNFNISFGYPRKDTCSTCDSLKADMSSITTLLNSTSDLETRKTASNDIEKKTRERELHLKKSERFYSLKRSYRKRASKSSTMEGITMDYQKNLPCPNITTNDVYYKRQLNFISFNIHVLSNSKSVFYSYDESVAKKGADDVCSMLNHFFYNILPMEVKELAIFCDSCAGQNKNFTVIRFLHYLVTKKNRFDIVKVIFPIRGHSYLECDRNMSLVNQKAYTEVPEDWRDELRNCRLKPTPFEVIDCSKNFDFEDWTTFLSPLYPTKCPFPTRPIRMLKFCSKDNRLIFHKSTYMGLYYNSKFENKPIKACRKRTQNNHNKKEVGTLQKLYQGSIPIKKSKWKDLQDLTAFLEKPESRLFYQQLTVVEQSVESDDEFVDDPPIDV